MMVIVNPGMIVEILYEFNKGDMSQDRIDKLNSVGFIWDALEAQWEEKFARLLVRFNILH